MLSDIQNRADIELLMEHFYNKLLEDKSIAYLFTDVAKIDLKAHLPRIVDFWENILFNSVTFNGNVFEKHLQLHQLSSLKKEHFDTWLTHLYQSTDELFVGNNAEKLKTRALSIATIMQSKILSHGQK